MKCILTEQWYRDTLKELSLRNFWKKESKSHLPINNVGNRPNRCYNNCVKTFFISLSTFQRFSVIIALIAWTRIKATDILRQITSRWLRVSWLLLLDIYLSTSLIHKDCVTHIIFTLCILQYYNDFLTQYPDQSGPFLTVGIIWLRYLRICTRREGG